MAPDNGDSLIQWLEVRNFRGLEHVRLEGLGRVNLIVGKNGVGKTTLLEAIRFYATSGDPRTVWEMLVSRDEVVDAPLDESKPPDPIESPLLSFFQGRPDLAKTTSEIFFGSNFDELRASIQWKAEDHILRAAREKFVYGETLTRDPEEDRYPAFVLEGRVSREYRLNRDVRRPVRWSEVAANQVGSCNFVSSDGVPSEEWPEMWDEIALTDAEDDLIKALRFLTPGLERLTFVGSRKGVRRIPVAKVTGVHHTVPFRSLGDGVYRSLGLLVTLVSMRVGGILLIDEIENGIHYSAQEGLWRILIDTAIRFNVQIFATTHSSDCIRAFQRATAAVPGPTGVLTRLEQRKGKIVATQFDEDELRIAGTESIEVR